MRSGASLGRWCVLALCCTHVARAEPFPSLDLHAPRPPVGHVAALRSESPQAEGNGQWHWAADVAYTLNPVQTPSATGTLTPLGHQLLLHALAARGLGNWLTVAADLPFAAYQSGDTISVNGSTDQRAPRIALGDAQLRGKVTLFGVDRPGGFQLGLLGGATLPTGNARSYLGEHAATVSLAPLTELDLIVVRLRTSVGARLRTQPRRAFGERFAHTAFWSAAAVLRPQLVGLDDAGRWNVNLEAFGSTALGSNSLQRATSPVGAGVSTQVALGDWAPLLGVELPLNDALGNPDLRVVARLSWAPRTYDADEDGVPDDVDECPEIAEDHDGFEDTDGCQDPDDDDDGVLDKDDKCPFEREDEDGFADDDGCADIDNDGDGTLDRLDACPDQAGPALARNTQPGCPVADSDGDGVPDDVEVCVKQREDRDGFEDADGCPDPDNDRDGVPDRRDRCPNEPGERRLRGCPAPAPEAPVP